MELKQLEQYLVEENVRLKAAPDKAEALLRNGESPQSKDTDRIGAAALMETIQIIFNLDEILSRP